MCRLYCTGYYKRWISCQSPEDDARETGKEVTGKSCSILRKHLEQLWIFLFKGRRCPNHTRADAEEHVRVCLSVCVSFSPSPHASFKKPPFLLFLRCQIIYEGFNLGVFFLSLFSFTSSLYLFFHFCFGFVFLKQRFLWPRLTLEL